MAQLFPVFVKRPPEIDAKKLLEDLEKLAPNKGPNTGVRKELLASCAACGWSSGPVDSREALEDLVAQRGGQVLFGGSKFQAECPLCYAPLTGENV